MEENETFPAFGAAAVGPAAAVGAFQPIVGIFEQAVYWKNFTVDTEAGNQIAMSLDQMRELLTEQLSLIDDLKTRPRLGDLPEAQFAAKLDVQVASGDAQSLEPVLKQFARSLERIASAVRASMANYEQVSTESARRAQGLIEGLPA